MGNNHDPFAGVEFENLKPGPDETPTPPQPKEAEKPKSETRGFKPVSDSSGGGFDASPIDPDELFSFGEQKFNELIQSRGEEKPKESAPNPGSQTHEIKEVLSPEMVEISASMYVMMLEGIWGGICQWFSGVEGNYDFDKKMRDRYEKVTAMYFQVQNVSLTPSHFFALMTVFVLFGSGFKAYKDRKKRITAASFAKKSRTTNEARKPGEQATLFDTEPIVRGRIYFAVTEDTDGKVYYSKHATTGAYAKKSEREEVPPHLQSFILDFKERQGNWPGKKEIDAFLKTP